MNYYADKPRFPSLEHAAIKGRCDTARGGPWLDTWHMTRDEWNAYCTALHRQAYPGSGNRRQRRYARTFVRVG
jgi:hypothetical protein